MGAEFGAEARIALFFPWSRLRERSTLPGDTGGLLLYFIPPKGRSPRFSANIGANVFAPCIARPQSAEAMSGAVWRSVFRSGATSIEGDHDEKRQFQLIHHQVSDWPEAEPRGWPGIGREERPSFDGV
jgi:hypothetical protein